MALKPPFGSSGSSLLASKVTDLIAWEGALERWEALGRCQLQWDGAYQSTVQWDGAEWSAEWSAAAWYQ